MYDQNVHQDSDPMFSRPAHQIRRVENRLDAVCDLIEQELHGDGIDDAQIHNCARRIVADVDTVMAEETHWLQRTRCEV